MTFATSQYQSRVSNEPRILERHEPVVYRAETAHERGPLNPDQVAQYARCGYLALPGLFSEAEMDAYRREFAHMRLDPALRGRPEVILEPAGDEVRSFFAVHRLSAVFRRLSADPRLTGIARQLLDSAVYIHQSRINIKPAYRGREFYWHSDFETWHVEDGMPGMRALSCLLTLTHNTPHNGPLMLIPGSQEYYVSCVGETPDEHYKQSLRRQQLGTPDHDSLRWLVEHAGGIDAPTGPPGTVILFDCNVMHGSNANITPWPRTNVFFVYNSTENALTDPFCGKAPRPDFVASRDFTPVTQTGGAA